MIIATSLSGTPMVDKDGNILFFTDREEFKYRVYNVFNTQTGSEPFAPNYGFDQMAMKKATPRVRPLLLRSLATEALNPLYLEGLISLNSIAGTFTGSTGIVSFNATDSFNNNYNQNMLVGD